MSDINPFPKLKATAKAFVPKQNATPSPVKGQAATSAVSQYIV